jgi:D-aminopeptidase
MLNQKRALDFGVRIGRLNPGKLNSITDIGGVRVGHVTLDDGECKTGGHCDSSPWW